MKKNNFGKCTQEATRKELAKELAKELKVNFCSGFVDGLRKAYEAQIARDNSMALMVIPPAGARKEQESWKTLRGGFAAPIVRQDESYLEGFENGYQFANRKAIEA